MVAEKMRYGRRRNQLLRYKAIMDEFNKHDCRYIPIAVIWREFIYPKFFISRDTLYRVLNTAVDEELAALPPATKQLTLFDN
ncbi:hypothetical protein [Capnocytophaga catalasegens]|uniref:Transposase n=1 Tax=Capnocytophaga catalasegens TaxID=1004260 RepID=A0AAV5AVA0_9FLAO|nr:hypothetical protein [Capnocytophaga catalasegens]GIZ15288.1 hypothetical protein RCZ03_12880 [Capnocytophaga catalasegens]GJM51222.1 hypothetical protein RCZ15_21950 [Capnocytophaga catalasegens]GJM53016.1 hypothetical protein RCZ16_13330 [Capnocytophaga catalasegens]